MSIKATPGVNMSSANSGASKRTFNVTAEYNRCINELSVSALIIKLSGSGKTGVVGLNGVEYPVPTLEQVSELFYHHKKGIQEKFLQGFTKLELTPLAMPLQQMIQVLQAAIIKHGVEGKIFRARHSPTEAFTAVRVNKEKHVWAWSGLEKAIETGCLLYFPVDYKVGLHGQSKEEVILNVGICAIAGWSIGLVEPCRFMPAKGWGKTIAGRKQPEIGCSPKEYLELLKGASYKNETGKTLEDFITEFLTHLEMRNEVNFDIEDENALWCLGHYYQLPYAEVVPTARWVRQIGRVRLDMHRTGNKLCAPQWGITTVMRLPAITTCLKGKN